MLRFILSMKSYEFKHRDDFFMYERTLICSQISWYIRKEFWNLCTSTTWMLNIWYENMGFRRTEYREQKNYTFISIHISSWTKNEFWSFKVSISVSFGFSSNLGPLEKLQVIFSENIIETEKGIKLWASLRYSLA